MLLIEMLLGIRQFLKTQTCYIALGDLPRIGYIGLHWISEAINPLSANPTKWPNTLKQFVGKLPTNCLSVFGHFVNLALEGFMFKSLTGRLNHLMEDLVNCT